MIKQSLFGLMGAVAIGLGLTGNAEAASFNFSYTSESGDVLAGMLNGDILGDGDTVVVSGFNMVTSNGADTPDTPFVDSPIELDTGEPREPVVSFSGQVMDIFACTSKPINSICNDGFIFESSGNLVGFPVYAASPSFGETFGPYDAAHWSLSLKDDPTAVPEPISAIAMLAVGAVAGGVLKQKQAA